ncbi:MAG: translocation/assembly module TamB domain-containing protein [Cyanobacteria bacterium P01_E01_bin.6]
MTQLPQPPEPNHPNEQREKASAYRTRLLIVLGLAAIGVAGGAVLRQWVYTRLVPLVEQSVSGLIDRPVEMGAVEGFSLTHVRFGETVLPPTISDPDRAIADAVHVSFNPLEVLINRSLSFKVTLITPTAIVEQDESGLWVDTQVTSLEPGTIEFKLDSIRFQDAHVVLIPASLSSNGDRTTSLPSNRNSSSITETPSGINSSRARLLQNERELPEAWPQMTLPFVWLQEIDGIATLRDENKRITFDIVGQPGTSDDGGTFDVTGELNTRQDSWQANVVVRTQNLDMTEFLLLAPELPVDITTGRVSSNLRGVLDAAGDVSVQGTAQLQEVGMRMAGVPSLIELTQGDLQFRGQQVQIENSTFQIGSSLLSARGRIDLQNNVADAYNLTVVGESLDIATVLRDAEVSVPIEVSGQLNTTVRITGPLAQPSIAGTMNHASTIQVDRLEFDAVGVRFRLLPNALEINTIQVSPSAGGVIAGSGKILFDDAMSLAFALDASNVRGDAIARQYFPDSLPEGLVIGSVSSRTQLTGTLQRPRLSAQWTASEGTYPAQGTLTMFNNQIAFRDVSVQVGEGSVLADADISLADQTWQAIATVEQLVLDTVVPDQPGILDGDVIIAGTLQNLNPAAIEAEGRMTLTDFSLLDGPLTAQGRWIGTGLQLDEAIAPNLQARGFVGITFPSGTSGAIGAPIVNELDLDVLAQNVDLSLGASLLGSSDTDAFPIAGLANFDGQITGSLAQPTVDGNVVLQDLVINGIAFEPQMLGSTRFTLGEGGAFNLAGQNDRITVAVDERYYPTEFLIRRGQILAQGETQDNRLQAQVANFPIGILNIQPAENLGLGALRGNLTGSLSLDLATLDLADLSSVAASGDVEIIDPSLGHIEGDRFTGRFIYGNGIADIRNGTLVVGTSNYGVSGRLSPTAETLFQGQITADNGDIQDLLVAFKYFELQDLLRFFDPPQYGVAADLDLIPIRISEATLLRQLQRYAEISTLLRLRRAEDDENTFFPSLQELSGNVSGMIDLTVSQRSGLMADFDLVGENWEWGTYAEPNQIIAQGSFSDNTITLLPFRFSSGETLINFAGQVGQAEDSQGQLQIENVPAELVADFVRLPIGIAGNLNSTATVTGSINNLQARGEFSLVDGLINQTPIQETEARFSYADARLNLIGSMLVSENDPIRVIGSVPYRLPQGIVEPDSDEINLDIQIENDGLALLNVLNDQVRWTGGEASVSLQVGGTLRQTSNGIDIQPLATGFAELNDGAFSAQVLPAPLTGVTGIIQFNRDRIQVNDIRGQFSDGEFVAQGVIPLATPFEINDNTAIEGGVPDIAPLTVDLNDLAVTVKGLYNGAVNGQMIVQGTALAPRIGGQVTLSDGRVSLTDPTILGEATAVQEETNAFATLFSPPELDNLQVILGNRLLITRAPILNFVATGSLMVDGPLNDFRNLMPDGEIRLRSGQVNVFTTQFNLLRGRDNVAIFRPRDGLDPFLNVRLATSILEQTRSPIPTSTAFTQSEIAEIADSSANDFGGLETVRIQATVVGPASQIFENLELTSSPSRSENEILALIGGGFADTQGQGDSNLAIASLAGTALFTSLQNLLSNALGISDFRIFPAVITDDEREDGSGDSQTSTLGIAAELGVDLTGDLSISALQFLTLEEPTQFNLRYQINDQLRLRGTTNFSDENRAVLEFETRF